MPLQSMTGFARAGGFHDGLAWHWEIRTVNGRGLELRLRLPPGYENLEPRIREACSRTLSRGNCTINLTLKSEARTSEIRLNENALRQVVMAAGKARQMIEAAPLSIDGLLSIKGVIEITESGEADDAVSARLEALFASFLAALQDLIAARRGEGARLADILGQKLGEIGALAGQAQAAPARSPAAIQQKLTEQLQRLKNAAVDFDETRLYQEAVLLAARADIEEEIARLQSHVAAALELLDSDGPAGRKLEFLTQEFHREANTLCAKSNALEITRIGLQLKSAIDQLREQVQNIE